MRQGLEVLTVLNRTVLSVAPCSADQVFPRQRTLLVFDEHAGATDLPGGIAGRRHSERSAAGERERDGNERPTVPRGYRHSSTDAVFAYVAPMIRQYGFVSPPTTTTWMSSRRYIGTSASGAAFSFEAHGSSPKVASG